MSCSKYVDILTHNTTTLENLLEFVARVMMLLKEDAAQKLLSLLMLMVVMMMIVQL